MRLAFTAALLCCSTMAHGAVINGDFDDGLNGYTLDACGFNCGRDTDPFFDIQLNGADPYLEVNTSTSLLGVTQASATTDIEITSSANILTFDAVQFASQNDPGSNGAGPFFDALSILLIDQNSNFHFVFDIVSGGAVFNPFFNPNLTVTETAASDPFFDIGVMADLSAFEGQTLTLGIFAFTESDGNIIFGGFDNFTLSAEPVSAVPIPASLPMLLGAFGILGLMRRRPKG